MSAPTVPAEEAAHRLHRAIPATGIVAAAVPLLALALALNRFDSRPLGDSSSYLRLEWLEVYGVFAGICGLSILCLLLLRQLHREWAVRGQSLAYYDALTGLPNRRLYGDRVERALRRAKGGGWHVAVCFLDLDGFKRVNDTLGHDAGDRLLCQVAERLVGSVRLDDSVGRVGREVRQVAVSRLGGDEFTFLLARISKSRDAGLVAHRVLEVLQAPFTVGSHELFVTASIGVAVYPDDGLDAPTLLKHADTAMYHAKGRGRNNYQFFSRSMNRAAEERLELETRLRGALERDELKLHYQPVRSADSGEIAGAEALLRWEDSELGTVSPASFVSIAEEAGLINAIGEWVLRTACEQSTRWQKAGFRPIRIAVNVSGRQLRHPAFVETVAEILCSSELPADYLELEITEASLLQNDAVTEAAFRALERLGVRLTLDDFGTGYSSLSYLRRYPIQKLKIDRCCVSRLPGDVSNEALTSAILAIGRSLGFEVVAEGVETAEQAAYLTSLGCDYLQGHLISAAVPDDAFRHFLERDEAATPAGRSYSAPNPE